MRPDCFGQYSAHPRGPCRGCALQGPCAHASFDPEGFLVLSRPRYCIRAATSFAVDTTSFDPLVANDVHRRFPAAGFERSGGRHDSMYFQKKPKVKVGCLVEAKAWRVVFYFDCLRPRVLNQMPTVRRLQAVVQEYGPAHPGSLVVVDTPATLAEIALDVATHLRRPVGSQS